MDDPKEHIKPMSLNEEKEKLRKEELKRKEMTQIMFTAMAEYVKGELNVTVEDFKLMEAMNKVTQDKYTEMTAVTKALQTFMQELQKKYQEFQPYLEKIDQIDSSVTELEHSVQMLDDYTKRLEEKFKKVALQRKELNKRGKV